MKVLSKMFFLCGFLWCNFLSLPVFSQVFNDYGFTRSFSYPQCTLDGAVLKYPWVGGLNSCQFNAIDLNFDQVKDLVVFDRIGERLLTFINNGTTGTVNYTYAPQYERFFPNISSWILLKDYNCDGKEDIFAYGFGGIKVYKNVSNPTSGLSFELVTNQLLSYMYNGYVNIYVTDVDYPAIEDFDGDGDLDILAFWILGTFVHYHKNLSVEESGTCDSLKYRLKSSCWGFIREGDTSNYITLNAPCPTFKPSPLLNEPFENESVKNPGAIEHVGSTLLGINLNGDSLTDLILGDVDYPTIISLINGGTHDTARIVSQDTQFPSYDTSINIFSFPALSFVDVNNDNKRDLLASPFDPISIITQSHQSVWLYDNIGSDDYPEFHLNTREFLQGDMIDAGTTALPVFCDVNQDGLTDIVLGNYGFYDSSYYQFGFLYSIFRSRMIVLMNTGTPANPEFTVTDNDFAGISGLNITNAYPTFGDVDHDGDLDMIVGNTSGTLYFFENIAGTGNPLSFSSAVPDFQGIDAGSSSTPQLWDLDDDGKLDLIIGNKKGLLAYFRNTGTLQSPVFTWVTDSLGKVDVRDPNIAWDGNSVPCFFRTPDDSTHLFVGALKGGVSFYKNIDGNANGPYTLVDQNYLFLRYGSNSGIAVADLDQDGYPDMIMGNTCGGLAYFRGSEPDPIGFNEIPGASDINCQLYPNPVKDIFILDVSGNEMFSSASFRILDNSGREVRNGAVNTFPATLQCPSAGGVYYVYLTFYRTGFKHELRKPLKMVVLR
ncbi:MAG: FG-GAP repeat domain-containing protein [Bacteroidales bacterium]